MFVLIAGKFWSDNTANWCSHRRSACGGAVYY